MPSVSVSKEEFEAACKYSLPVFAQNCIKIKSATGLFEPFRLNRAQKYLHEKLEKQRKEIGYVRAIIVKGRRMGCSTYIGARYYHQVSTSSKALSVMIFSHAAKTTSALFQMAKDFHRFNELLAQPLDKDNENQLIFAKNRGSYTVATAATSDVGRGLSLTHWHASEVGFWDRAEEHVSGVGRVIKAVPGTEIILESTANGKGNFFHRVAMAADRGEYGDYQTIFMPWWWDDRNQKVPTQQWGKDFLQGRYGQAWVDYAKRCGDGGLTYEHVFCGYLVNQEMATALDLPTTEPCWKFKQEFPSTLSEAFQTADMNCFIPSHKIDAARKVDPKSIIPRGKIILGVDPSRVSSGDKVGVIDRQGRIMGSRICAALDPGGSVVNVADKIAHIIRKINPDIVNIDVGGVGAGVYDILVSRGFRQVRAVNFGGKPIKASSTGDKQYLNRRAEIWDEMREWFNQDLPVKIPDSDALQQDLECISWGPNMTHVNSSNILVLEPKESIKKRLGRSCDLGDAAALSFSSIYEESAPQQAVGGYEQRRQRKSSITGY